MLGILRLPTSTPFFSPRVRRYLAQWLVGKAMKDKKDKKSKKVKRKASHSRDSNDRRLQKFEHLILGGADDRSLRHQLKKINVEKLRDDSFSRSLQLAVSLGDIGAVSIILGSGHIDVNILFESGLSALHMACLLGDAAMASQLRRFSASEELRDLNGETPRDLGLQELIEEHNAALTAAEAEIRAIERERLQEIELRAEVMTSTFFRLDFSLTLKNNKPNREHRKLNWSAYGGISWTRPALMTISMVERLGRLHGVLAGIQEQRNAPTSVETGGQKLPCVDERKGSISLQ